MMNNNRHSGLVILACGTALILAACGSVDRAAPLAPLAPLATIATVAQPPCAPYALFDGSTFESIGLGRPTVIDPVTGEPSNVYVRFCAGRYDYRYVVLHRTNRPGPTPR